MKIYIKSAVADPLNEDYDTKWELAQSTDSDGQLLDRLSETKDEQLTYQILQNPNVSPAVLRKIVDIDPKSYEYDRRNAELAMQNPNMPIEVLRDIEKYSHLRDSIALNPSTPRDVLEKLIQKGKAYFDRDLLGRIASNPNAPEEFLLEVINGNSIPDKCMLAKNPNISYDMQKYLYSLNEAWIDENLAANPGTAGDILQKLYRDTSRPNGFTRALAYNNLQNRGLI